MRAAIKTYIQKTPCFMVALVLGFYTLLFIFPALRQEAQASFFEKKSSNHAVTLSGFEPGAKVQYKILSGQSETIYEKTEIDQKGDLNIQLPETYSDEQSHIAYDFAIDESSRELYLLLRLNSETGAVSIKGQSTDTFSDVKITAPGQNIQTRTDWAGLFEETGIRIPNDNAEPAPVQVAFYSGNIASDAQHHQSPALVRVQLAGGGGSPANIIANYINPMQLMAEHMSAVAMQQTQIIGSFFDAKLQLENQRTHQKLKAEAVKDYHPSEQMCRVGSYVRSLASAQSKMEHDLLSINKTLIQTYMNEANMSSDSGEEGYYESRLELYKRAYCDTSDNDKGLDRLCKHGPNPADIGATIDKKRVNKDVDFSRTAEMPYTLDVDFTDANTSKDETDVIALARNLYWPNAFSQVKEKVIVKNSKYYVQARQLMAFASLAHNSYAKYIAMKSSAPEPVAGAQPGWAHMKTMLRELGMSDIDIETMVGERPSYHAQMDILTKKAYQNPNFYTNLYDKPANIDRISASLDAIKLMQLRDHYDSSLRREMLASGLVQNQLVTDAEKLQGELLDKVN